MYNEVYFQVCFHGKYRCNLEPLMKVYYIGNAMLRIDTIALNLDDITEMEWRPNAYYKVFQLLVKSI